MTGLTTDSADTFPNQDRCTVCHTTDVQDSYKGKQYCHQHLQERLAQETGVGY